MPNDKSKKDLLIILVCCIIVFFFSLKFDWLEKIVEFSNRYEKYEIDELISLSLFLVASGFIFTLRRIKEIRHQNKLLAQANQDIEAAASEIKKLKGIIPICASCKKIRDDQGFWQKVETYIEAHSEALFTHCLCEGCAQKLYPEIYSEIHGDKNGKI